MKKSLALMALITLMYSCKKDAPQRDWSGEFDQMLVNYAEDGKKLNPLFATFMGDSRYNDLFPNYLDPTVQDSMVAHYNRYKAQVVEFPDSLLSSSQQMSKAVLLWECDINLEGFNYDKPRYMPIDQMWSPHLMMGQLGSGASAQPFKTVQDYENWIKRTDGFIAWLNSARENMEAGMGNGYVLPASLVVKVVPQLRAMSDPELEDHLFYGPVANLPSDFSAEDKERLTTAYSELIEERLKPSYLQLAEFMEGPYSESARESSGIQGIPEGDAYYAHQIKLYTTTEMTAAEIHDLGLSEVARIRGEMEKVMAEVGFEGDLRSFFDHVRSKPELMPYTDPQQVIDHFNAIHEKMKPQIEVLFDKKPKTSFEVRRTEAFRERSASAEYNPGSLKDGRPGIFYVPIPDVTAYNIHGDESLFLHEAIPGHHYQVALTQENDDLPDFRKNLFYSGYGEGWALYAESLGKELGLLTDPYQYFGMLGAEMHRAIRLVVDTGLHYKGWSREEAIEYSLNNEAESEASITAEIERYMANPGQALSYKIGQLTILRLRQEAEAQLGDAFDIREFHNQVLETGSVPLALLEEKIANWIAASL
ncbi:DUF885 domain-containing protein [Aureitalea marina]|uniref:DUF885 domain-containing protein n=1 Tax=Aureitalea marina TaxID=930804 RepID=A0A2S7KMT1_9FLAO|nr:DUF885 domain-containing protein [Aureitalea marina]PQB03912.1 hypothetical protein BST85_02560 [Aureitalea marina]